MRRSSPSAPAGGRETTLAPLIHGRVRLLILSHLMRVGVPASFTQLRRDLRLTDGTLSVHLSRLEEGGMIAIEKQFVDKRPRTLVRLTPAGRRRFRSYVRQLRQIVPGLE